MKNVISYSKATALAVTAVAGGLGTQVSAQDWIGSAGFALGINEAREIADSGTPDRATVGFAMIDGTVAYNTGRLTYALDVTARYDDFAKDEGDSNSFADGEDPESRWQIGGHALWSATQSTKLGGFVSYGSTVSQDAPSDDEYDVWLLGFTGQTEPSENFLLFGQIGFGNNTQGEDFEDEGFRRGFVLRSGMVYFATDTTAVSADLAYAGTVGYIDNDDVGAFLGFELSGETRVSQDMPLSATYGIRHSIISSTEEGDALQETELFAGLLYTFGGVTVADKWRRGVAYGTPDLPLRASAWTEWAD